MRLLMFTAGLAFVGFGCATKGPSAVSYSVRSLSTADVGTALDAAEASLVEQGFRIASRDSRAATITTVPVEVAPNAEESGLRSLMRTQARRVADVRVERAGTNTNVYCKVSIQEQETEARQLLAYDRASSDVPHETPIDRGAYTTAEQNMVWRTVRRDGAAEREILAAVMDRLGQSKNP